MHKTFAFLFFLSTLSCGHAAEVIGVEDGDTLTILENSKKLKIDLAHIDAPEPGQPFGKQAKQSLVELCSGKQASYEKHGEGSNGRLIATVVCNEVEANRAQLKRGLAWILPTRNLDFSYVFMQDFVWQEKVGLWADPNPVPPWEWRKRRQ